MADENAALARLCDPAAEVSCHYLINRDGTFYQLVKDEHVAWHAGVSQWGELEGLNQYSIGIELSHPGLEDVPYTEAQYAVLIPLLQDLLARHTIPPENVLAHSDIAPERKTDPGPMFDWSRLAVAGVGLSLPHRVGG